MHVVLPPCENVPITLKDTLPANINFDPLETKTVGVSSGFTNADPIRCPTKYRIEDFYTQYVYNLASEANYNRESQYAEAKKVKYDLENSHAAKFIAIDSETGIISQKEQIHIGHNPNNYGRTFSFKVFAENRDGVT